MTKPTCLRAFLAAFLLLPTAFSPAHRSFFRIFTSFDMDVLVILFWVLLATVFYSYFGYALVAWLVKGFGGRRRIVLSAPPPAVTIVIACYNEEKVLPQKIANTLALDYPPGLLSVIVVDDGSTDATAGVPGQYPGITLLHHRVRRGKMAALNTAMPHVRTPIVVFSDANSELNRESLALLVRHFADERVGAVAGEKKVAHSSGMGSAEGWYWRYESAMKALDASLHTVLGATGELFAMRTRLYRPISEEVILDDLMLSMSVNLQGYTIAYEPAAFAVEAPSATLTEEGRRKVRIATGAFQLLSLIPLRRLWRQPVLGFQFFSRRWLRWVVCPFAIPLLLLLNAVLAIAHPAPLYDLLLAVHLVFYGLALVGWGLLRRNRSFLLTTLPFYFLFMNLCMLLGLQQFRSGSQSVLWAKAER